MKYPHCKDCVFLAPGYAKDATGLSYPEGMSICRNYNKQYENHDARLLVKKTYVACGYFIDKNFWKTTDRETLNDMIKQIKRDTLPLPINWSVIEAFMEKLK